MKTCLVICAVVFGLLIALAVGIGLWVNHWLGTYQMPDRVMAGNELSPEVVEAISGKIRLRPGETIEFFYSGGVPPQMAGDVITNQRVVSYEVGTDLEEADYSEVVRADGGSFVSFELGDEQTVYLSLSEDFRMNLPAIRYLASHGKVGMKEGSDKIPGEQILTDDDLTPRGREAIATIAQLEPDEKIVLFQPSNFWTFDDRGYVITDQRVIDYSTDEEGFSIGEARLDEVAVLRAEQLLLYFEDKQGEIVMVLGENEQESRRQVFEYLQDRGIKIDVHPIDVPEGFEIREESLSDESLPADDEVEEPVLP